MLTTLPFAWTQDPAAASSLLINPPNDLSLPGSASSGDYNYYWVNCLGADNDTQNPNGADSRSLAAANEGIYFAPNDNLYIEAVRLESPFGDGLVCVQPQVYVRIMFTDIRTDLAPGLAGGLDYHTGPSLYLDLHQPFGDWQEVGQYLPLTTNPLAGGTKTGLRPRVLIQTYDRVWKTLGVDPGYAGLEAKVEVNLKVRHNLPRNTSGAI